MLEIRPLLAHQWPLLKSVRLKALADAPEAFCTTLAQAQAWSDQQWQERATRFTLRPPATACIALLDGTPCGMLSCYLSEPVSDADGPVAELTAFWVAPEQRGQGIGKALIACVVDWAASQGVVMLQAQVTKGNRRATAFYGKVGFQEIGRCRPNVLDPSGDTALLARKLELPAV